MDITHFMKQLESHKFTSDSISLLLYLNLKLGLAVFLGNDGIATCCYGNGVFPDFKMRKYLQAVVMHRGLK